MNLIEATYVFLPVAGDNMDLFEALAATNVIGGNTFVPIAYAEEKEEGLLACQRFVHKCVYPSELFRDVSKLPRVPDLNE
jgi:hypothetical protein